MAGNGLHSRPFIRVWEVAELSEDLLAQSIKAMQERVMELEPLVDEHARLTDALAKLGIAPEPAPEPKRRATDGTRTAGRKAAKAKSTSRVKAARRAAAMRKSGAASRVEEALELVRAQPGKRVRELAEVMGISDSHMHGLIGQLVKEGKAVKQDDKTVVAVEAADSNGASAQA